MIDLDAKEIMFAIKIIGLNAEIIAEKIMMTLVFEINSSNIHIVITLINQNIILLL